MICWQPSSAFLLLVLTSLIAHFGKDARAVAFSRAIPEDAEATVDALILAEFPVFQRAKLVIQPGGARGMGLLAEYPEGGPRKVFVSRHTSPDLGEPYVPITLIRVFDPSGNLVLVEEWTEQPSDLYRKTLSVPEGAAGVWRVSFSGGRKGDVIEIGLPTTPVWGVRGEMALGTSSTTPRPAWVWVPPASREVLIGIEAGPCDGIGVYSTDPPTSSLATMRQDPTGRAGRLVFPAASAGGCFRLNLPEAFEGALVIEGTPGLLCPTREAAEKLRGGTVESHGLLVAGPLQARARNWMHAQLPHISPTIDLRFPQEIPENLENMEIHALAFGKYGPLSNLDGMVAAQNRNLQPDNPFLGSFLETTKRDFANNWSLFRPGRWVPFFDSASLAAAATFDSPMNPAFKHPQIVSRATLAAFYHIASLQGDDLIRENSLFENRFPMILAFFVYPGSLSQGMLSLRDQLDPEALQIWNQGLMAVGDKLADFQGFQSNQWAHMLRGHLDTYLATGEKRFLGYFERLSQAFLDNTFGPNSKFGQHPSGFFLEEYGPDGNYDRLNLFAIVSSFLDYRELPDAKPELLSKFRSGIQKNLEFRSLFWLPRPDGSLHSPTAINSRTLGALCGAGYPGDMMARADFPLGSARFAQTPEPHDIGIAWTMPHVANTEAWSRRVLEKGIHAGAGAFPFGGKEATGWWLPHIAHAYSIGSPTKPAELPVSVVRGEWSLPGVTAWKRGDFYCVVVQDIPGGRIPPRAIIGGAPMALWTKECGPFVSSMHAESPGADPSDENSLTYACVYFHSPDGHLLISGKEPAQKIETSSGYEFVSQMPRSNTPLRWHYLPSETGLELRLSVPKDIEGAFLNIPFNTDVPGSQAVLTSPHSLKFSTPTGAVECSWNEHCAARLEPSKLKTVSRLIVPVPGNGQPLTLRFNSLPDKRDQALSHLK